MKKILSILLALTLMLSLCVCVNAADVVANAKVSELTKIGNDYYVTVDFYFTGEAQALYAKIEYDDTSFELVTDEDVEEDDDYSQWLITKLVLGSDIRTEEAVLTTKKVATYSNENVLHLVYKALKNVKNAKFEVTFKSTPDKDSTPVECNVTGDKIKIITVDKFTCEHNWIEKVDAKYLVSNATCTAPAKYYKSCSECGEKSTETFNDGAALGHTSTEKVEAKYLKSDATCSSPAVYYKSCSVCGEKLTETFEYGTADASKHVWENKSDDSKHWEECTCGAKQNEEAHSYTTAKYDSTNHWMECSCGKKDSVTAHTMKTEYDSDNNKHWHTCEGCEYTTDEANHIWDDNSDSEYHWKECSECGTVKAGSKTAHTWSTEHDATNHWSQCPTCGYRDESTVVAHDFENGTWDHDGENHWKVCSCGAEGEHTAHTEGTPADCTHKAVCADCGEEYGDYKHVEPLIHVERVEATKESDGNIEYWYCSGCNQRFLNEDGTGEISESQTIIRYNQCDANGHQMATIDCGSDDYHMMICANDCGTILLVPHSYSLDGVCSGCGHTIEVELEEEEIVIDIPVESTEEEVDTDDANTDEAPETESNPVTGVAFSAVALVAAAAVLIGKRRQYNSITITNADLSLNLDSAFTVQEIVYV